MHTDERDEFQRDLYMPGPAGSAKGGSDYRMCQLWLSRVFICGLMHIRYITTRLHDLGRWVSSSSSWDDKQGAGWHEELVTAFITLIRFLFYLFPAWCINPAASGKEPSLKSFSCLLSKTICTILFKYCVY